MKDVLKKLFAAAGYDIRGTKYTPRQLLDPAAIRLLSFDDAVCRLMYEKGQDLTFLQVGVYDGVMNDPLRKYIERGAWRGALVEPQSRAITKLEQLYRGDDRIQVVHAALDSQSGSRKLYTVESDRAPVWAGGLASFDKDVILKHRDQIPGLETAIREETVSCTTFDNVLARLGRDPDILQIDTEGADAYILSLFPLDRVRPAIVHWEVKHLSTAEREGCMGRLAPFGYRFAPSGGEDMLAVNF